MFLLLIQRVNLEVIVNVGYNVGQRENVGFWNISTKDQILHSVTSPNGEYHWSN